MITSSTASTRINDDQGCQARICMACNDESRAMETHIRVCGNNNGAMVPNMSEYSQAREAFLAPVRRKYAENIRSYLPEVQQIQGYSRDDGFGYGTLAWTLCSSGYKVTCKVCPRSFTVDPSKNNSG
eukprot:995114-Karenia_brevis.AAC.1